jgi:hypothetical protein
MAEVLKTEGDALSRLIQLHAGRFEIRLTWSGKGVDDLIALCNAHAVKARMAKHLWTSTRELVQMPEIATLPESIQAQIYSIILKAQTLVDLDTDEHAKRMAIILAANKPKSVA